jgi:hypothetical protein
LIASAYVGDQQNFIEGSPVDNYQYITIAFALVRTFISRKHRHRLSGHVRPSPNQSELAYALC